MPIGNVAIFDEAAEVQNVINYIVKVDTDEYQIRADVVINPDISNLVNVPWKYWKHVAGQIVEMTPSEKQDLDNQYVAQIKERMRKSAINFLEKSDSQLQRAIVLELLDYVNATRQSIHDILTWLGSQTSLNNRGILGEYDLNQASYAQAKNAIKDRINNGEADS